MQKMLKNVKKKDCLTFFISNSDQTKLAILIQPSGVQNVGTAARAETVFLNINCVDVIIPDLPNIYINQKGEEENVYGNPMVIDSVSFQKIKKMTSVCKTTINVAIQKNNYISFCVGDDNVMGSHLEFGELTYTPEEDYETDTSNEAEEESSEESSAEQSSTEKEYPFVYEKDFDVSLFAPLVKLPGLCNQMEFYAPNFDGFPLKVNVTSSSGLGDVTIYLKDREYIELVEAQLKTNKK
jgi:hypothetical protein